MLHLNYYRKNPYFVYLLLSMISSGVSMAGVNAFNLPKVNPQAFLPEAAYNVYIWLGLFFLITFAATFFFLGCSYRRHKELQVHGHD